MPKQTFLHLPEEKRLHIEQEAIEELYEFGYAKASISRIVQRAGIAKGSFYQYFDDLDDLYIHIITVYVIEPKRRVYEQEEHTLIDLTLTEFLRKVFLRQLREFSERPKLLKVAMEILGLTGEPVYQRLMSGYQNIAQSFFIPYIRGEKSRGQLDPAVDERILNFMLSSLGQYVSYFMLEQKDLNEQAIHEIVDKLEYILTNGIYMKYHS